MFLSIAMENNTVDKIAVEKLFDWEVINGMPINECHEPLEIITDTDKLRQQSAYFFAGIKGSIEYCTVRENVARKLVIASQLLPPHLGLLVLDGWRSRETQQALQEQTQIKIADQYRHLSVEEQKALLQQFVAPAPTEQHQISPHLTGGSVDVTLFDVASGKPLFLGTEFDEVTELSYTAALEKEPEKNMPAILYRRLLYNAMIQVGFTNLPTEWWHYDYGNSLWAFYKNDIAIYGAVDGTRNR
ncbi:putative D-alanyl-D-alanine dipeptidase [Xenorhabdus bovienii str. Jollieti]|uniref:D-alanyl-D-alanine dipeptidase n=2 Tax=Xenorhabdus bovienii TaxID=40576 RepID=D3UZ17_XENBS|nr:M15 family metallopeptidase [Xenorhabdus bovienii]CBJ79545.1 putative D-alanyl-D-alanine dipeptidase [Xenorhabdus bovienii SS-2004]CDH27413.1 putative D-alanyl-D-alanine dipeptidase [Xenorhabdus bovienii str. Jollieti]